MIKHSLPAILYIQDKVDYSAISALLLRVLFPIEESQLLFPVFCSFHVSQKQQGTVFSSVTPPRSYPDVKETEHHGDLFCAANMKQYSSQIFIHALRLFTCYYYLYPCLSTICDFINSFFLIKVQDMVTLKLYYLTVWAAMQKLGVCASS